MRQSDKPTPKSNIRLEKIPKGVSDKAAQERGVRKWTNGTRSPFAESGECLGRERRYSCLILSYLVWLVTSNNTSCWWGEQSRLGQRHRRPPQFWTSKAHMHSSSPLFMCWTHPGTEEPYRYLHMCSACFCKEVLVPAPHMPFRSMQRMWPYRMWSPMFHGILIHHRWMVCLSGFQEPPLYMMALSGSTSQSSWQVATERHLLRPHRKWGRIHIRILQPCFVFLFLYLRRDKGSPRCLFTGCHALHLPQAIFKSLILTPLPFFHCLSPIISYLVFTLFLLPLAFLHLAGLDGWVRTSLVPRRRMTKTPPIPRPFRDLSSQPWL